MDRSLLQQQQSFKRSLQTTNELKVESRHVNVYVHEIINELKKSTVPLTVKELKERLCVDLESSPELLARVRKNERIIFHLDGSLSYRPLYAISSAEDLLNYFKHHPKAAGIPLADLKEGFPTADAVVSQLAANRQVFVLHPKEDSTKVIFPNRHHHLAPVEEEFRQLWDSIKLPTEEHALADLLNRAGLQSVVIESINKPQVAPTLTKKPSKRNFRKPKYTNTHIPGFDPNSCQGADLAENTKILRQIVNVGYSKGGIEGLREVVNTVSKKRGVLKQAYSSMIQEILTFAGGENREEILELVRESTVGKIHVEAERAHATRELSAIKEGRGEVEEAAKLLLELPVETFGSLPRAERVDLILEQFRLALAIGDHSQATIISRKLGPKVFEDFADAALRFHRLAEQLSKGDYAEAATHRRAIHALTGDPADLAVLALQLLLAPHNHSRRTELSAVVDRVPPQLGALIRPFLVPELIDPRRLDVSGLDINLDDLSRRVLEHNLRTVASVYSRISLARLASLTQLAPLLVEKSLAELQIPVKIDRVSGIATFAPTRAATAQLDDWSRSIDSLLRLMVKTNHLVAKVK